MGSTAPTEPGPDRLKDVSQVVTPPVVEAPEFSLVLGGLLYQLWRRTRLSGDALELLRRRVVVMTALAWLPLLILSAAAGTAWSGVSVPFLYDIEVHARFLLAVPLLIMAELVVHRRVRPLVLQFVERGIIPDSEIARFEAAVASSKRLRNSPAAELAIIALVYLVGLSLLWRTQTALGVVSWNGALVNGSWRPSPAGWWLGLVSLPLFQFLLLRWYFRLAVWARFLWQVSRIDLRLMPTHPDRCGGIGFLASVAIALSPILLAQGVVLAGLMANRIFYAGATLPQYVVELIGLVALMVFVVLGPLLFFCRKLEIAKRTGVREYGVLAQRYVREYDHKWLRGGAPPDEPLLGSGDIQSLADLANSFEVVKDMRWVPFTLMTVVQMAVTTLLPVLPLTLTMLSAEDLLKRLLKVVF